MEGGAAGITNGPEEESLWLFLFIGILETVVANLTSRKRRERWGNSATDLFESESAKALR
jgi:hypothetical protein